MAELDEKLIKSLTDRINELNESLNGSISASKSFQIAVRDAFGKESTKVFSNVKKAVENLRNDLDKNKIDILLDSSKFNEDLASIKSRIKELKEDIARGGTGNAKSFVPFTGKEFDEARKNLELLEFQSKAHGMTEQQRWEKILSIINQANKSESSGAYAKQTSLLTTEREKASAAARKLVDNIAKLEEAERKLAESGLTPKQVKLRTNAVNGYKAKIKELQEELKTTRYGRENLKAILGSDFGKEDIATMKAQAKLQKEINALIERNAQIRMDVRKSIASGTQTSRSDELATRQLDANIREIERKKAQMYENEKKLAGSTNTAIEADRVRHENAMTRLELNAISEREKARLAAEQRAQAAQAKAQADQEKANRAQQRADEKLAREQQKAQDKAAREQKKLQDQANREDKRTLESAIRNQKEILRLRNEIAKIQNNQKAREAAGVKTDSGKYDAETKAIQTYRDEIRKLQAEQRRLEQKKSGVVRAAVAETDSIRLRNAAKEAQRYASVLDKLKNSQKGVARSFDSMIPSIQRIGNALGVAFSVQGLVQFGKKLIETRGQFEMQQVALRSILQNREKADELWDKTMRAALQSPFTAMQLTRYTKQLAAYRIETEKLFDTTKRLADISAGLGVDMDRLILAYGQVKAANFLRASEVRQFTEAGINIYGELAKYFTELKENLDELPNNAFTRYLKNMNKEMVTTKDVIEMVTKRLVRFEDVEEIFKRMTDEGGIFFNMQYIQSQTVKGQINKLHDAYDQMLNTIGQANEGTIKDMVDALNRLVRNWRAVAGTIKAIGFAMLIGYIVKTTRNLYAFANAADKTTISLSRMETRIVGVSRKFRTLGSAFKGNLMLMGVMAVTAAITRLQERLKEVDEINKQYDELIDRNLRISKHFTDLTDKVKENNEALRNAEKGSEEYNNALSGNKKIVQELNSAYPEFSDQVSITKDGMVELGNEVESTNQKLKAQMLILQASKATPWGDDLQTNLREYEGSLLEQERAVEKNKVNAEKILNEMEMEEEKMAALYDQRKITKEQYVKWLNENNNDEYKALLKGIANAKDAAEQERYLAELELKKYSMSGSGSYSRGVIKKNNKDFEFESVSGATKEGAFRKTLKEREKDVDESFERILATITMNFMNAVKRADENAQENTYRYIKENGTLISGYFDAQTGVAHKDFNDFLLATASSLQVTESTRAKFQQQVNLALSELGQTFTIDWSKATEAANAGDEEDDDKKKKQNALDQLWRRRIKLIEEMRKRYQELAKEAYSASAAQKKITEDFGDSFKKIFAGTGLNIGQFMVMSMEDMMNNYSMLQKAAKGVSDSVKDELAKNIDSSKVRIQLQPEIDARENLKKDMEKLFSEIDMTKEMQKLHIPQNVAESAFNFSYKSMSDAMDRLQKYYNENVGKTGLGEEDVKLYQDYFKKISEAEMKERQERVKEYSKFLEKELSERAKIEMQYAADVANVMSESAFTDKQKEAITAGIKDKYDKSMQELSWKSFKESEFYVEMMDDITSIPADYAEIMLNKLNEIIAHPEDISPRALKEAINARNKIIEAQMSLDPLNAMRKNMASANASYKEWKLQGKAVGEVVEEFDKLILDKTKLAMQDEEEIHNLQSQQGQLMKLEEAYTDYYNAQDAADNHLAEYDEENLSSELDKVQAKIDEQKKKLVSAPEGTALTEAQKSENEEIQASIGILEGQMKIINDLIDAKNKLNNTKSAVSPDVNDLYGQNVSSDDLGKDIKDKQKSLDITISELQSLKKGKKDVLNFSKAWHEYNKTLSDTIGKIGTAGQAFYDVFDALGGETNALTEGWKEFGTSMVGVIQQALTLIPTMITGFDAAGKAINTAMGWIGLVAEAVTLLLTAISAIAKLHDSKLQKDIEYIQKDIDSLTKAYGRLEKAIERTVTASSYMAEHNAMIANLREQITSIQKQMAAERAKWNTDEDKLAEYQDQIDEIIEKIEDAQQEQIELFGGIGEQNYRSGAEEFVSAWKDAFLETGDGLTGLQEHFDEFLEDWFVKQANMRIAGAMLQGVFEEIDRAVKADSSSGVAVDLAELQAIREKFSAVAPELSAALEQLAGMFDLAGEGTLSGLAAGIQGMTEEQANILEAYWNSVRMYTASIDNNVARIAQALGVGGSTPETNPMLQQLQVIAQQTAGIRTLLDTLSTNNGQGRGFRVYQM